MRTSERFELPPDGAQLSAFEVRRAWLSQPELVYRLPKRGIAVFTGPGMYPFACADGGGARWHVSSEVVRPVALHLEIPWADLWRDAEAAQGPTVVLRYDSLFRQTCVDAGAPWLAALLRDRPL